jgi:hypothetical protein
METAVTSDPARYCRPRRPPEVAALAPTLREGWRKL